MAAADLPEPLVEAGRKLLSALDDAGLQAQGAAWIFDHALRDWRFVVATSLVETMGRSNVYKQLLTVMKKLEVPADLTINDIHLVSPSGPLFRRVAGAVHIHDGVVRFKDRAINGAKFDAIVYRWVGEPSAAEAAKVEKHFKRRAKELSG